MAEVKAVTAYQTTDERIFKDCESARIHQLALVADETLFQDPEHYHGALQISSGAELIEFLERNRDFVIGVLSHER